MKKYLLVPTLLLFTACGNDAEQHTEKSAGTPESNTGRMNTDPETLCFIRTEGTGNQDTDVVKLIIDGNKVTGELKYMPDQKDWARGNITGTKEGAIITADWHLSQEGMEYNVVVMFKLEGNKLYAKEAGYTVNGADKLPKDAPYIYEYQSIDCNMFPTREY